MSGAAFLGALTGCVGYVDGPRHGYAYAQPSPVYVQPPSVEVEASVGSVGVSIRAESDFYEPLTPHGEWVVIGTYGRCWRPGRVEAGWRPYCNGYWQRTDAGWYWVSDEPWAWATYHYGRWDFTEPYGWYWVPQTQWAPAWVSWHSGGGYVGWAPLLPSVRISASGFVGFNASLIAPRAFVFVEQRRFLEPIRPTTVVVNNTTIINKTTTITNTRIVNNTVINEGPATTVIEKAGGRKVQAVPVRELRQKQEAAVVSKQRTPASISEKTVQTPVRNEAESRGTKARLDAPPPAKELEATAQKQSQKTAQALENKTPVEPQRRANETPAKAQEETRGKARETERKAQQEAQRGKELEKIAQEQSRKSARELATKTQVESQRPTNAAAAKIQEDTRGKAKASERTAQREIQRRKELEKKAQAEAERKAQKNKGKGKPSPPEGPPATPPASP